MEIEERNVPNRQRTASLNHALLLDDAVRLLALIFVTIEVHGDCSLQRLMTYEVLVRNRFHVLHDEGPAEARVPAGGRLGAELAALALAGSHQLLLVAVLLHGAALHRHVGQRLGSLRANKEQREIELQPALVLISFVSASNGDS